MTRIHQENINTAAWFDSVWNIEGIHRYDVARMEAFLEGIRYEDNLLDVAAGWMGIAQYAIEKDRLARAWATDFSWVAMRKTAKSLGISNHRLYYHIFDALELGIMADSYDRVVCGELIEHIEHPSDLVKELVRVCKPGGRVIIGTLDDTCEDAKRHGDYPEHLWSFMPTDLVELLAPYVIGAKYRLVGDYHFVEGVKR